MARITTPRPTKSSQVTITPPSGMTSTTLQEAIEELEGNKLSKTGTETITNKTISFNDNTLTGVAPLNSPAFTGTPTVPTPSSGSQTNEIVNAQYVSTELASKQDTLVSGTNIKTVGSQDLLGSGNIDVVMPSSTHTLTNKTLTTPVLFATAASATVSGQLGYTSGEITFGDGSSVRTVATTTNIQTLTNKTLTTPTLSTSSPSSSIAGQLGYSSGSLMFSDGSASRVVVTIDQTQTLTNKTLTTPILSSSLSGTTAGQLGYWNGTLTFGNGTAQLTVITDSQTQTLTNKTLTTPILSPTAATGTSAGQLGYSGGILTFGDGSTQQIILSSAQSQTVSNKMIVASSYTQYTQPTTSGSISLSFATAHVHRITPTANISLSFTGWHSNGYHCVMKVNIVNGGLYTITFPSIQWIKRDGSVTTTFSSYLTDIGRSSLQTSGIDEFLIWTDSGGSTLRGKIL